MTMDGYSDNTTGLDETYYSTANFLLYKLFLISPVTVLKDIMTFFKLIKNKLFHYILSLYTLAFIIKRILRFLRLLPEVHILLKFDLNIYWYNTNKRTFYNYNRHT